MLDVDEESEKGEGRRKRDVATEKKGRRRSAATEHLRAPRRIESFRRSAEDLKSDRNDLGLKDEERAKAELGGSVGRLSVVRCMLVSKSMNVNLCSLVSGSSSTMIARQPLQAVDSGVACLD